MNRTIVITLASLMASALISLPAFAGIKDTSVNKRQHNQTARVAQGVKSGQLTREETKELRSDRRTLRQKELAYKADGQLTKDERIDLHKDLKTNSKEIYAEKHDVDVRSKAK